jgi:steroid delta-isomerase-like uncharacterized protein
MSVEENIEVVRRFGVALTDRDWAAFDDLVAEDCVWTDVPTGLTMHGREELIAGCKGFTNAFPDFTVESVTLIGQGDLVANEWSARGTHEGPLPRPDGGHYEPTGRSFARSGVGIVELRNNQIVRYRDFFDRETMTVQLGLDDGVSREG